MASLTVFPAIDLKGGQVVRLAEGDMDRATVYGDDPAHQATLFADAGADHLHVVDLDGAFAGQSVNGDAVAGILKAFPGRVQLGGGIRNRANVDRWLDLGVARVVIGTAALEDPDFVREAAAAFRVVHRNCVWPSGLAAVGSSASRVVTRERVGWLKDRPTGVSAVVCFLVAVAILPA